jgi:hypothetical protein
VWLVSQFGRRDIWRERLEKMKNKPVRIILFVAILIVLSGAAVFLLGRAPGSRNCLERFSGSGSEPCRPDQVDFWWRLALEVLSDAVIGLIISGTAWGAALLSLLIRQKRVA